MTEIGNHSTVLHAANGFEPRLASSFNGNTVVNKPSNERNEKSASPCCSNKHLVSNGFMSMDEDVVRETFENINHDGSRCDDAVIEPSDDGLAASTKKPVASCAVGAVPGAEEFVSPRTDIDETERLSSERTKRRLETSKNGSFDERAKRLSSVDSSIDSPPSIENERAPAKPRRVRSQRGGETDSSAGGSVFESPYFVRRRSWHRLRNSLPSIQTSSFLRFSIRRYDRRISTPAKFGADMAENGEDHAMPSTFLRTDSIIIRVEPGQRFSEFANVIVESPARCDPRLGTLGELRHHLRTGTKQQVKRFLRQNNWTSGHRIRAELWKELCHDNNSDAQRAIYRDIVDKIGTIPIRPAFLTAPGIVLCDHQLKETGRMCLTRLLMAVEHQRPDFTYVPVLYPLGALFLHYMNEEEAFACLMNLMSHSQKFLTQSDVANVASKRTMLELIKKHVNRAYALFKRLSAAQDDKDLVPIFDEWKCWIFRDLPFSHLVRVVDCFLFEGQKVLYRVALAILYLWSRDRAKEMGQGKTWSIKDVGNDISSYCNSIKVQPPKLLKTAFGIRNLKMATVRRLQQKYETSLRSNNTGLAEAGATYNSKQVIPSHQFFDVKLDSSILDHNQAMQLISWLPSRYQLDRPLKLFSINEDGTSFTRLWTKLEAYSPTVILIRTSLGEIFGAFCSSAWDTWKKQSGISYFGTGETFLFRFSLASGEGEKFAWIGTKKIPAGHREELFLSADATTLVIGGGSGEGLSIRDSLVSGSTGHCDTFDNPALSSERDFEIEAMEVFAFAPGQ